MGRQLTLFDYQEMPLKSLEIIIERGLSTFIEVGLALLAIRDGKKYKEAGYTDFHKYIEDRWGMSNVHGYRLLNAGYIASELLPIGSNSPINESQVRPLTRLGTPEHPREEFPQPDCWIEAWQEACDLAGNDGIPALPTAKEVEYVVKQMLWVEPPPIPAGEYRVIYADPPWQYDFSLSDSRMIENQYPTMEVDDICALQILSIAADDCVLFMWATNPKLREALQVINAWGFEYKTNMVWIKDKIGMGYYARQQHELLLIATHGEPPLPEPANRPSSIITGNRIGHSQKPEAVYSVIEAMYPAENKIELFARTKRAGWEAWGNER